MSSWFPLVFGGAMYAWLVANYIMVGRYGMALCFTGYVIGNIGLILDWVQQGG